MDLPFLLIWLVVCLAQYAQLSRINRQPSGDKIYPESGSVVTKQTCSKYGASCIKNKNRNCTACKCGKKMTFYKEKLDQLCVLNPNTVDGCRYYLNDETRIIHSVPLKNGSINTKIGIIQHDAIKILGARCTATRSLFWNLVEWKALEKNVVFNITEKKFDHVVRFHTPKKNGALYKGMLIKLEIQCVTSSSKAESCVIFKVPGVRKYATNPEDKPKPKKPEHTSPPKVKKLNYVIVIASVVAGVLLIIIAIIICCCWKRRRKTKYENGDVNKRISKKELLKRESNPEYQTPERFSGRRSEEINHSADNLTYLQPVDVKRPTDENNKLTKGKRHGNKKRDPNYDYPDVNIVSMSAIRKSDYTTPQDDISDQKPIYAEVGDPTKFNHQYTDPNYIKPRIVPEVVGVPGYQPPRGPVSAAGNSSKYSDLDLTTIDQNAIYQPLLDEHGNSLSTKFSKNNNDTGKDNGPPSPQYAELMPDVEVDKNHDEISI